MMSVKSIYLFISEKLLLHVPCDFRVIMPHWAYFSCQLLWHPPSHTSSVLAYIAIAIMPLLGIFFMPTSLASAEPHFLCARIHRFCGPTTSRGFCTADIDAAHICLFGLHQPTGYFLVYTNQRGSFLVYTNQ